ncbi:MAG: DEAD/DEAH box helicase [Alphaproteobacteria bacterium]|nr:DEAD/DEAH box helicase [Alphaproteobacteria bacterium]
MTTFADLGLSDDILRAIQDIGYTTPTPIQEQAIPHVLMMRDLLGCAQTGTGKTAGFVLPMLEMLGKGRARARMPRSLILEPTRELAAQVAENFENYGKYHKLSMARLTGGESMDEQIRALDRGVDVLIATPGRMMDLFDRGRIMLADIKIFVIDEADRMLDMGFIPDVERIAGMLPPLKQTLFFSATMPPEIRKLADRFLSNPKTVTVSPPASTAENVAQKFVMLAQKNDWLKRETLRALIERDSVKNAFIFCNRKRDVALLHKSLVKHGLNAGALHGDMEQSERTATLDKFRRGEIALLVCSDVAARGLDIDAVSHVFNFDVPFNAEDYVHRIGRTGRAGLSGIAYTLVMPDDLKQIAAIESLIKQTIERETIEGLGEPREEAQPRHHPRDSLRDRRPPRTRNTNHRKEREKPAAVPATQTVVPLAPPKAVAPRQDRQQDNGDRFNDDLPAFLRHRPAKKAR